MMTALQMAREATEFTPYTITRPDKRLFHYYVLVAALTGPLLPFTLLPLWIKYVTLRYRFDEEGISMSWGLLFRKEVLLTYRRIQDIHLTRNIVQRWMDLATVSIQTASGASSAEMSIEGLLEPEALRDFLYQRMRGAKGLAAEPHTPAPDAATRGTGEGDRALLLLEEIRDAIVTLSRERGGRA
jgi:putative membrane protein